MQNPDGPVLIVDPDHGPALAIASGNRGSISVSHDFQIGAGEVTLHFTMAGVRLDLKAGVGGNGKFHRSIFRIHLNIVAGRGGGLQGNLAVVVVDANAVFEVVQ